MTDVRTLDRRSTSSLAAATLHELGASICH